MSTSLEHASTVPPSGSGTGVSKRVAVLGAGIAGLVAATELRRHGVEVVVYEAGPRVAGMAESHNDLDGFSYDTGAHVITNRLAATVGVEDRCGTAHRQGEAVFLSDRPRRRTP